MLFPTLDFLLFFLVVAAAGWLLQDRFEARKLFLVAASYFFYAQWNWRFCFLLFGSSVLSYSAGWLIANNPDARIRKRLLTGAVGLHLCVLGIFKYCDFFIGSANELAHSLGLERELPFVEIILPVGISFFTFHGISYLVDVYRGDVRVCRRFTDMLLYISFFPQLVAGPIVRASYFLPQLTGPGTARVPIGPAVVLILGGFFKKMVVANYLATDLVDPVFAAPTQQSGLDLLFAVYGYAIQIYCDFSAYSDMAIGFAALLGFRFPRNFDQPYRAQRLREFWQRWHISLSSWLRDYLYKPLGGNRRGPGRTYLNLAITMLLGGIWHGAAWKFVFWGALHGSGLAIERAIEPVIGRTPQSLAGRVISTLIVFHIVCLGWVFFRADSFETAWLYLGGLGTGWSDGFVQTTPFTLGLVLFGAACQFIPRDLGERFGTAIAGMPVWSQGVLAGCTIAVIDALGPDGVAPFIYFQF
jgi:D-alanyl-lipoteichoic acid acyltransferase DltB (MBOAT superfamily)